MMRGNTTVPNQDAEGKVLSQGPCKSAGAWRGREGYKAFTPIVKNTRFVVRPDADSALLWTAWHIVMGFGEGKPVRPPLQVNPNPNSRACEPPPPTNPNPNPNHSQCTVCDVKPAKATVMNFVSTGKSSAECACSWRPLHGTAQGREALADIAAKSNNELIDSEADWTKLHLHRSERWRVIGVRCLACKRERHVTSGGVLKHGAFTQCICVRKAKRSARVTKAAKPKPEASSAVADDLLPSEVESDDDL